MSLEHMSQQCREFAARTTETVALLDLLQALRDLGWTIAPLNHVRPPARLFQPLQHLLKHRKLNRVFLMILGNRLQPEFQPLYVNCSSLSQGMDQCIDHADQPHVLVQ